MQCVTPGDTLINIGSIIVVVLTFPKHSAAISRQPLLGSRCVVGA